MTLSVHVGTNVCSDVCVHGANPKTRQFNSFTRKSLEWTNGSMQMQMKINGYARPFFQPILMRTKAMDCAAFRS